MLKGPFTHTGVIISTTHRRKRVKLRETKLFWIGPLNTRYRKKDGMSTFTGYVVWHLDLKSIEPMGEEGS